MHQRRLVASSIDFGADLIALYTAVSLLRVILTTAYEGFSFSSCQPRAFQNAASGYNSVTRGVTYEDLRPLLLLTTQPKGKQMLN